METEEASGAPRHGTRLPRVGALAARRRRLPRGRRRRVGVVTPRGVGRHRVALVVVVDDGDDDVQREAAREPPPTARDHAAEVGRRLWEGCGKWFFKVLVQSLWQRCVGRDALKALDWWENWV